MYLDFFFSQPTMLQTHSCKFHFIAKNKKRMIKRNNTAFLDIIPFRKWSVFIDLYIF